MNIVTFYTSNKGKFLSLQRSFTAQLPQLELQQGNYPVQEIQSMDIAEISAHKAQQIWHHLKQPLLVHDGGFYITALHGFPGPYTAQITPAIGVDGYIKLLAGETDRTCQFCNVLTYVSPNGQVHQYKDDSGLIFNISEQAWPHDHPQQWSPLWRVLESRLPQFAGKPIAAFTDTELTTYHQARYEASPGYFPALKQQLLQDFGK